MILLRNIYKLNDQLDVFSVKKEKFLFYEYKTDTNYLECKNYSYIN